jgi:hypothetical protein
LILLSISTIAREKISSSTNAIDENFSIHRSFKGSQEFLILPVVFRGIDLINLEFLTNLNERYHVFPRFSYPTLDIDNCKRKKLEEKYFGLA